MQTPILILMLAFGVPGANSCTAQQQPLPRVGQTPAPAAEGSQQTPPVVDDQSDGEEDDMDVPEADDDSEGAEVMAEQAEIAAEEALEFECAQIQAQAQADCQAHCEGQGSCQAGSPALLGRVLQGEPIHVGKVVRLKEKDLGGKIQNLSVEPGSTVILETKDGKQVVLRTEGLAGLAGENVTSIPTLAGLFAQAQATPQSQDERVRELEKRVRELEAQLRERDGQRARTAPRSFSLNVPQARAQADEERARAAEMRQRMSTQAREYARISRQQAEELRKHALEQAEQWRAHYDDGTAGMTARRKFEVAPEPAELPEPPPGAWHGSTAPAPEAPMHLRSKTPKPPKAAKAPKIAAPGEARELQAMMEQMRAQMEEMRAQMQALRDELQKAPQREMR